jgi:dolichol-phosphate mannosyltransferase
VGALSIVIPVRNERESLPALLAKFEPALAGQSRPYRILLVDGASTDGTPEVARAFAGRLPLELLELGRDAGLGGALEAGLLAAIERPGVVVTMDGDDSHDPATIPTLLERLDQGHDVVIASRFEPGGAEVGVAAHRRLLSHAASALLRLLFPAGAAKDYSSGFRAYRTEALENLRRRSGRLVRERGFACMAALLLDLRAAGARVGEVPLVLRYDLKRSESKMDVGATVLRYLALIASNLPRARGVRLLRARGF